MAGLEAAFERIGASAEHHLEVSHSAGLALAVTDREEVLGVVCRGLADVAAGTPVRPETRFHIGSISKSFAAMIVLQEVAAGRLDLHVSVNEILPWLELPEPFGPITMHDLMTHTAGLLVGTEDAPTGPGALHRLKTNPATTKPGERWLYSNDGWKVVGACLEEVTGEPVHELLRTRVLGPLGMRDSGGVIDDATYQDVAVGYEPLFTDRPVQLRHPLVPAHRIISNTADGSIISNVLDMSAYGRLFLARADVPGHDGQRMLSEESFDAWIEQRVSDDEGGTYGYGLWSETFDGVTWIAHSGGMVGYTALFAVSPADGLGCIVLQNGYGEGLRRLVRSAFACVRAALAGEELPEALIPPSPTTIANAADYAGTYTGEDGRVFEVEAEREGLRLDAGPVTVMLERDPLAGPSDGFLVPHEALERYALLFARDAERDRRGGVPRGHVVPVGALRGPGAEPGPRRVVALHRVLSEQRSVGADAAGGRAQGRPRDLVAERRQRRRRRRGARAARRRVVRCRRRARPAPDPVPRQRRARQRGRRRVQRGIVVPLVRGLRPAS